MGRLKGRKMLCTREETVTRHHEHSKGHVLGKNGNQDGWGCLSVFSQLKLRGQVDVKDYIITGYILIP